LETYRLDAFGCQVLRVENHAEAAAAFDVAYLLVGPGVLVNIWHKLWRRGNTVRFAAYQNIQKDLQDCAGINHRVRGEH